MPENGSGVAGVPDAQPGPSTDELAVSILRLADRSELKVHSDQLRRLARSVQTSAGLTEWADLDLVGTFARSDLIREPEGDGQHKLDLLNSVLSVLVFLPVIVTWFGLVVATEAYRRMISAPNGTEKVAGRSFLQLWQQGFDGALPVFFSFGWMAIFTLILLGAIIVITLYTSQRSQRLARTRRADRELLLDGLVPLLIQAQLLASESRLSSPVRFAAELSRSGRELGELIERTVRSQEEASRFAAVAQETVRLIQPIAQKIQQVNTDVLGATAAAKSAFAATQAASASLELAITSHLESGTRQIREATDAALIRADQLGTAGQQLLVETARRIEEQLTAADGRQRDQLTEIRADIESTAAALRKACEQLAGAGTDLSEAFGRAGRDGAQAIGETYRLAVAAAATSLGREMATIGSELAERIEDLRALTEQYGNRTQRAADQHGDRLAVLAASAGELGRTIESGVAVIATALVRLDRAGNTEKPLPDGTSRATGGTAVA